MTTELKNRTEADAVNEIAHSSVNRVVPNAAVSDALAEGLMVFQDKTIRNLESFAVSPKRKRAIVSLVETKSFINYVKAHLEVGCTHLFAVVDERGGKVTAIIDYHEIQADDGNPGWGEHVCELALATTPEWQRWTSKNGVAFSQEAFAEFLQDNMPDIVSPDAGQLIDIAQMLIATKSVRFQSGKNLKNGAVHLDYVESIDVRGVTNNVNNAMDVPDAFKLGICPFVGGLGIELNARLRFRIADQKLTFHFVLDRPHKVIEAAVKLAIDEIERELALPVHLGTARIVPPPSA